ncbi:MAG TPA: hypothetical protein VJY62_01150 [Bacteroidia bacterium]|nr:hypothetical protein [Bacteroidia bacterium]
MKNYHWVIFIIAVHFLSCSKKKDDNNTITGPCSDFTSPYVSNDGPLSMGSTLRLSASSSEDNITYEWTGPKNFSSDDQNPEINNISFDAGGTYFARAISATCTSNTSPTNVIVNAPCPMDDNTGLFGSATWNFNSSIACGINSYGYVIAGSSIHGEIKIKFATDNAPVVNKILKVDDPGTAAFDSTEIQLSITNSAGTTFTGQSGSAYVSNYGTLSVVFCGVPFKSSSGTILIGGAKINCQ